MYLGNLQTEKVGASATPAAPAAAEPTVEHEKTA